MTRQLALWTRILMVSLTFSSKAQAFTVSTAILDNPDSLISTAFANAIVTAIGLGMDHHPYEPATPLGTSLGLDFGIEVTLAKPPSSLTTSLGSMISDLTGSTSSLTSSIPLPVLPSAKIHLHKGFGKIDIGLSALPSIPSIPYIGKTSLIGGDIKYAFYEPDEGPTFAARITFNYNNFVISPITISTMTYGAQILMSRKISFADPYLGLGFQYSKGGIQATIPLPSLPAPLPTLAPLVLTKYGIGYAGSLFGGVSLTIPKIGFRITLEGAYSTALMPYMGTKIGMNF